MAARPAIRSFQEQYAQIRKLPEGVTGEIIEPGKLSTMSRPGRTHRFTANAIRRSLAGFDRYQGGAGWWFEVEAEIRFGERLLVPDIAGWRVREDDKFLDDNPIRVAPDWACEVLSGTTTRKDRMLKLPIYVRSGVSWVWLVDTEAQLVEVYEPAGGHPAQIVAAGEADRVRLPPFDSIEIDLAQWWLSKPPAPTEPSPEPSM